MKKNISVKLNHNTTLNSPLILGANDAFLDFNIFALIAENTNKLGGFVTKSFTNEPRLGNKEPIINCTDNNLIVSSGIRNPGARQMLKEINLYNKTYKNILLIPSIALNPDTTQNNPEYELVDLALELYNNGSHVMELNLSCPNLNTQSIVADNNNLIFKIINNLKNSFAQKNYNNLFLIAKLAGDIEALKLSTIQAENAGADAITILPLLRATGFYTGLLHKQNLNVGEALLGNVHGTIYGSGLGPFTRKLVSDLNPLIKLPIIASGGCLGGMHTPIIEKADGLIQTMMSGATAIEVVTPFYPFNKEKLCEIDKILDIYQSFN